MFDKAQIAAVQHLSPHVMVASKPEGAGKCADLALAVKDTLETEERRELDHEEQEDEDKADYVRLHTRQASDRCGRQVDPGLRRHADIRTMNRAHRP